MRGRAAATSLEAQESEERDGVKYQALRGMGCIEMRGRFQAFSSLTPLALYSHFIWFETRRTHSLPTPPSKFSSVLPCERECVNEEVGATMYESLVK